MEKYDQNKIKVECINRQKLIYELMKKKTDEINYIND